MGDRGHIAGGEHIGVIGDQQPGVDHDSAVIAHLKLEAAAQAVALTPAAQITVLAWMCSPC